MLCNKNKKGFTLIELLAVIVILAVIALIATPLVLKYIDKARSESAEISALVYVGQVEKQVAASQLKNKIYADGEYKVFNGVEVSVKGSAPTGGNYLLKDGMVDSGEFCINGYLVNYSDGQANVIGTCDDSFGLNNPKLSLSSSGGVYTYPNSDKITVSYEGDGKLSCETSDSEVATCEIVNKEITVIPGKKKGTATLTIKTSKTETYNSGQVAYAVTTNSGVLNSYTANGYSGIYDENEHGISVSSDNSVIKYGTVEGTYDLDESPKYTDAGEYIVYFQIEKAGYENVYGSKTVVITKAEGNIELATVSGTIEYNKTKEVEIKENISNGEITISVANSNIVEANIVNNKLVIKGKQTGNTIITLVANESNNYNSASVEYSVEVTKANNVLTLSSNVGSYTYPNGGTFEVTENKSGGSLSCSSSDTSIAKCSISGNTVTVTLGTTKGTTTLTIKSDATTNYNASQAAFVVTTESGALSVSANGYTGVYDGNAYGISVSASDATISYGEVAGTYNLASSPKYTNAGEYTVYYQVSKAGYDTVTGSEKVVITKATGSVTAPTAKTLTYNESAQALINPGSSNTGTIEYKVGNGTYSTAIPTAINPGTYTVYYRVIGDANHLDIAEKSLTVKISEANLTYTSAGYTGVYDGNAYGITVSSSKGTIMYGTTSGTYNLTSSPTYIDVGTYTVYFKITREGYADITGSENVVISKADNVLKLSSNSGSYTYPNGGTFTVTENKSGGTLSCLSNNTNIANCSISGNTVTVTLGTTKGNATLTIKSSETKNYNAAQAAYVVITEAGAISVSANDYSGTYDGNAHGISVSAGDAIVMYGTVEGTYNLTNSPTFTDVGEYTVYYQVSKTGYATVTGSRTVSITKANGSVLAPTAKTLTYNGNVQTLINAGSSSTGTIQYKLGSNGTYSTSLPTATNAGTYTVYYKVIGDSNHNNVTENSISVTISKASGSVTAPTAKTLTYNGSAQTLINAGSSNTGTIQYKLGSTGNYSANLPTAIEAGNYKVYYKVVGNSNYNDVAEKSITVTIAKANNTLTLSETSGSYTYPNGGSFTITKNTSGGTLSCSSSNTSVATCSISETTVTVTPGTTSGTATITITSAATTNYNAGQAAYVVTGESGTLSVNANGYNGAYDGAYHGITVTATSGSTIKYGTTSGTYDLTSSPTYINVGEHTVYYQVSKSGYETITGSRTVIITKASGSVTAPTAKSLTYTGSAQTLINAGSANGTGTIYYKIGTNSYSTALPTATTAGTYTVYYKVTGDGNHNNVAENSISVTISKASNTLTLSASSGTHTYPTSGTFTVSKNTSGGTLSCSSSNSSVATCSISGTTVTVTPGTTAGSATITVTSASTTNYYSKSATYSATVKSGTLTVNANGYSGAYDAAYHGITVSATSGSTIKYGTTSGTYNLTSSPTYINAGTNTVYYQVSKAGYTTVTGSRTVTISKANNTLTLSATSGSYTYPTSGTFTVNTNTSGGSLSCSSSNTSVATCSISGSTVTVTPGTTAGTATLTITSAATTNYNSAQVAYVVTGKSGVLSVSANGYSSTYDGAYHGISVSANSGSTIKYGTSSGTYDRTSSPTYRDVGTYTVYYQVSKTGYTTVTGSRTVTISKASGSVTAPTAKTLTYTGSAQTLINAGSANGTGTIYYKVGTGSYSTSLPSATTAGTYTVYYKVTGDSNHNDVAENSISVTIAKKAGSVSTAPTAKSLTYTGSAQTLINAGSGTGTMYYKLGSSGTYSTSLPTATDPGTYTVYYYTGSSTNYNSTSATSLSVTIAKANNTLTLSSSSATYTYPTSGTFTVTKNTSGGTLSCSSSNTNVATCSISGSTVTVTPGTTAGTANITVTSAATTYYKSATATHVVTGKLGTLSVTANNYSGTYDGSAHGITVTSSGATIKYGTSSGTYNLTSSPTYTNAGTYTVYYQVTKTGYTTVTGSRTVTISKAAGKITTAPTGKSLTYTGSAQTLITAGSSSTGTMYYKLGDSGTYSTSLPTATASGTYTIYYYATASTNYNSTAVSSVTATIKDTLNNSVSIGDYVKMTPTITSYTIDKTYTGSTSIQTETINPSELNLWRVIRINSNGTIDMISENVSSTGVSFGGATGYKNVIGYLNLLASKYENSKYTIGSRYIGYNGQTEYLTDTANTVDATPDSYNPPWKKTTEDNSNESQGGGDLLYTVDTGLVTSAVGTLVANGAGTTTPSYYWLASRKYRTRSSFFEYDWFFEIRTISSSGSINESMPYRHDIDRGFESSNYKSQLRPIIVLKSGIVPVSGTGTSTDPYVLN